MTNQSMSKVEGSKARQRKFCTFEKSRMGEQGQSAWRLDRLCDSRPPFQIFRSNVLRLRLIVLA